MICGACQAGSITNPSGMRINQTRNRVIHKPGHKMRRATLLRVALIYLRCEIDSSHWTIFATLC